MVFGTNNLSDDDDIRKSAPADNRVMPEPLAERVVQQDQQGQGTPQADGRLIDPSLENDINRQRMEVAALEQMINKLPPHAQQAARQDLQAAQNAHAMGQLADTAVISRISQTVGEEETKEMMQTLVGGSLALAGAGALLGGEGKTGGEGLAGGIAVGKLLGLDGGSKDQDPVKESKDRSLGDILASYGLMSAASQGLNLPNENLFTATVNHGLGALGLQRGQQVEQGLSA